MKHNLLLKYNYNIKLKLFFKDSNIILDLNYSKKLNDIVFL
jgi:hypothetical protein